MAEAEARHRSGMQNLTEFIGSEPSKKRKRRTSFTPQALEILNSHFEKNTHPSGQEMTEIAEKLNYDREVVRVWFCNKRQALKNTIKRLKQPELGPAAPMDPLTDSLEELQKWAERKSGSKTTNVDELITGWESKNAPKSPGRTVMSLQTKTMCCQCDYHSYVNDLGETKNKKKEINIWELCKNIWCAVSKSFRFWLYRPDYRPNFGSHEEGFSKEIIPNQNTIYQSLLHLSTKNNFVM